jgi:Domain of unknown function (DUF4253)
VPYASLPADGDAVLGDVHLPAGQRVTGFSGAVVAWASDEPLADAAAVWFALSAIRRETGLVPVLLAGLDGETARPWDNGEFEAPDDVSALDQLPAERVLAACWSATQDDEGEDDAATAARAPFGRRFPGLAPPGAEPLTADELRGAVDALAPARLGLVAADRPADLLPRLGWSGVVNWYDSPLPVAAVLRSWEERFGATLLEVGFADIRVLVERPPRSVPAAERVAAEHVVFCDKCGRSGLSDITGLAASLVSAPIWSFWWD